MERLAHQAVDHEAAVMLAAATVGEAVGGEVELDRDAPAVGDGAEDGVKVARSADVAEGGDLEEGCGRDDAPDFRR